MNITAATVQTIVASLIAKKATMPKPMADILEGKLDNVLRALMRGQVLNAGVMVDDAAAFAALV